MTEEDTLKHIRGAPIHLLLSHKCKSDPKLTKYGSTLIFVLSIQFTISFELATIPAMPFFIFELAIFIVPGLN